MAVIEKFLGFLGCSATTPKLFQMVPNTTIWCKKKWYIRVTTIYKIELASRYFKPFEKC
jgi:hypothetical protein